MKELLFVPLQLLRIPAAQSGNGELQPICFTQARIWE